MFKTTRKSEFNIFGIVAAAALAGSVFALAIPAQAQDRVRYEAKPGSKVTIAGTSTIHDWTMEGAIIGGYFEVPAGVTFDQAQAALAGANGGKLDARAECSIPVRSMRSAHKGMDEVMQQAMNAEEHKRILYHLTEMTLKEPHAAGTPFQFDTKGQLIINGVTNQIAMLVTVECVDKTRLKISGAIPVSSCTSI